MSEQFYNIQVFDDGNTEYRKILNEWRVTREMFGGSKVALQNVSRPEVKISSISSWKLRKVEKKVSVKPAKNSDGNEEPASSDEGEISTPPSVEYSSDDTPIIIPKGDVPLEVFGSDEEIKRYLKTPEGRAAYGNFAPRAHPE